MLKVIGVGDNVVDRYLHLGKMFPGGNAVNFSVLARRCGHTAAYIGVVGRDAAGELLLTSLRREGVDISRVQVADGRTAYCDVNLVNGDRQFAGYDLSIYDRLQLSAADFSFISHSHLVHTSVYSLIDGHLAALKEACPLLSYDFSDKWDDPRLPAVLPYIDFIFFSGSGRSEPEVKERLADLLTRGPRLAAVTLGSDGALLYDGTEYYRQGVVPVRPVDTLGAGDAFLTRFLTDYLSGTAIPGALQAAAAAASAACRYYGAFGHGTDIK